MQKFVIGPCMNGLHITKKAIEYLAGRYGTDSDPKYICLIDEYSHCYNKDSYTRFENIPNDYVMHAYEVSNKLRKLMIDAVDGLAGNYSVLDKLNNENQIRLVEINDDKSYHIVNNDEDGFEWVEEVKEYHNPTDDAEYFAYQTAKRFLLTLTKEMTGKRELIEKHRSIVQAVSDGDYAIVRVMKRTWKDGELQYHDNEWYYFKAKYNVYYNEELYEILGQQDNAYFGTVSYAIDDYEYNKVFELMKTLDKE